MSIASKQAKERHNRRSDELVTDKAKISRSLKLQVTDVRKWTDVRSSNVRRARKSANFILLGGTGHPKSVGRLVVLGAPDVR